MRALRRQEAGAVLIFAVLLLSAGVFVLAGIAQLAATQALVGQSEWESLNRRVMLENSSAMARQFMLSRMFSNVISTNPAAYATNWGGFAISNTGGPTAGLYWTAASTNAGQIVNPFNLMERGGFYPGMARARLVDGIEGTNTNEVSWDFIVRTRSPIAAGYSFVQQRPEQRDFTGYVDCIDATNFFGFPNVPRMPVSSVTNTNQGGDGFSGFFGVPLSPGSLLPFVNTNVPTQDSLDPAVTNLVINLGDASSFAGAPAAPLAYRYEVDGSVTRLEIQGTDQGNALAPLQIVATNNPGLTNVILSGNNSPNNNGRRVYLHVSRSSVEPLGFLLDNATEDWRIGISVKNDDANTGPVNLTNIPTGVSLVGGIRTDGRVLPPNAAPVRAEVDPQGLDYIADQMMWLEDYRVP